MPTHVRTKRRRRCAYEKRQHKDDTIPLPIAGTLTVRPGAASSLDRGGLIIINHMYYTLVVRLGVSSRAGPLVDKVGMPPPLVDPALDPWPATPPS